MMAAPSQGTTASGPPAGMERAGNGATSGEGVPSRNQGGRRGLEALVRKVNEAAQSVGILLASEICNGMERTH